MAMAHVEPRYTSIDNKASHGFTLVEVMIVVAIVAILGAISIPVYNNYVETAQGAAARANVESLRLALENHFLDNRTYVAGDWIPSGANTLETGALGWHPDGDDSNYNYNVAVGPTGSIANSYVITVTDRNNTSVVTTCTRDQTVGSFDCVTSS
jgi:type IV pilus assembly protein PilE